MVEAQIRRRPDEEYHGPDLSQITPVAVRQDVRNAVNNQETVAIRAVENTFQAFDRILSTDPTWRNSELKGLLG
ncbi:hypothetical protein KKF81_05865 [Candidatus Micrarchaeota archaeon]|nr:hypothetical protein [Candidatus Micrarchaeota archaeon]MBU1166456.1 hypothetical protein [Candidatus Micrarchaeota archaeon]MBU1886537.1 hypothetical protein [Candidatus Micrarchaeota archaeon]